MQEMLAEVSATYLAQSSGDLGDRLVAAARELWQQHPDRSILFLGCDSPDVPAVLLESALAAARGGAVAIGSTDDGGFWCLGVPAARFDLAELLREIPWSSGDEFRATLARAAALGQPVTQLAGWSDVDHPADVDALIARLELSTDADDRKLLEAIGGVIQPIQTEVSR